jgi:3-oxoadipate enol-lactonase
VNGFEMAYDVTGKAATPLLLIHGFPLDRTLWAAQTQGVGDVGRVITPDLRGFGESGLPNSTVTIDIYAEDICTLLDALGIQKAIIGGLSMGGYITLAFYRKYPQRVYGLILANTKAGADSPEGKKGRDESAALVREKGTGEIAARVLTKMLTPKTIAERPNVAEAVRGMMARQPILGVVGALMAMRDRPDYSPILPKISVPTLIITSSEDTMIPAKESEIMRDAIPGARLITIPNAAHLSNFEQPEAFNRTVREFVQSVSKEYSR